MNALLERWKLLAVLEQTLGDRIGHPEGLSHPSMDVRGRTPWLHDHAIRMDLYG